MDRFFPRESLRDLWIRHGICFAIVVFLGVDIAVSQTRQYSTTFRPRVDYVERQSGPFTVIYQKGYDVMARQAAAELHAELAATDSLVSGPVEGREFHLPVVLNAYNDVSNGFVSAFPFKTEIELPTLRSPSLIGGFDTWTGIVGPHELVHAMHGDVQARFGVGRVLGWMGNDLERVVNLSVPRGWTEGVAVFRESRINEGAGRLTAPRFTMRYRAAMESDRPWSLAEMMEPPAFTQPFDRFYVGGAHAFAQVTLGAGDADAEAFQKTTTFYNRFPFFGFGTALWVGTGMRPGEFRDSLRSTYNASLDTAARPQKDRPVPTVTATGDGLNHYRPIWLDEDHVVTYVRGYDVRPGLYRYNITSGKRKRLKTQAIADNTTFSLSPDSTTLWTSRYIPDAFSSRQARAEVQPVDLETAPDGTTTAERGERTRHERVYAPAETVNGRVLAVRNDGQITHIVERQADGSFEPITDYTNLRVLQIEPSPTSDDIAVLGLVGGEMRIYRLVPVGPDVSLELVEPWIAVPGRRMYDMQWGPEGRYLLFSAVAPQPRPTAMPSQPGPAGTPNVYAFDRVTQSVTRHTDADYGALMPALSPDGATIAYIDYQHERRNLVTAAFDTTRAPLPASKVQIGPPPAAFSADAQTERPDASAHASAGRAPTRPGPRSSPTGDFLPNDPGPHVAGSDSADTDSTNTDAADIPWGEPKRYRAWRHLSPRVIYPVARTANEVTGEINESVLGSGSLVGLGAGIQGSDVLQRWSYGAEGWVQDGLPWGEASVAYAGFPVRPQMNAFHRPTASFQNARFQETGVGVGLSMPVTFASNVYSSLGQFSLFGEWRERRAEVPSTPENQRTQRATLTPSASVAYRLQQNPRDLIPNSGLVLSTTGTFDLWTDARDVELGAERGAIGIAALYLPWLSRWNTGIQLSVGVVSQRQGLEFGLSTFLPRGTDGSRLPSGTFLRWKAEVVQPLVFVDDGGVLLPVYLKALYSYGFASRLTRAEDAFTQTQNRFAAVGGGLGVRLRLFSLLDLDLRFGAAYRPLQGDVVSVYR